MNQSSKVLLRRLFRRRDGEEVFGEAASVLFQKLDRALVVRRAHDEADVPGLADAEDHFGVVIRGSVGPLLARERDGDAGVVAARGRRRVRPLASRKLDARPLAPEVDAGGGLDRLGGVRAADARRGFEEVEATVLRAAYELGVTGAFTEAEGGEHLLVRGEQAPLLGGAAARRVRS